MPKSTQGNNPRKPISKTLRFEVFKRDSFTCQYCGRKAPEVVLQIDHIKPVADGGTNDIMNLVTSCVDCNLGKGARRLNDNIAVAKQQKQAELLAERLEQIEMLRDWYLELSNQDAAEVEAVSALYESLTNHKYVLTEAFKQEVLRGLLKKFGLAIVLESLRAGAAYYGATSDELLNRLPGICACKSDPDLNLRVKIQAIMRKRFSKYKEWEGREIVRVGYQAGGREFRRL